MLLVTVYRERPFDKQSSSKIMCDKLRVSATNVFQQPLKCDNEEIDCDVAELDQKTKTNSTCYFSIHYIVYCVLITYVFNVVYCVLITYHACSRYCMTATAYKLHRRHIKESLGLHNCFELVANSDRKNIFYEKAFRYRH